MRRPQIRLQKVQHLGELISFNMPFLHMEIQEKTQTATNLNLTVIVSGDTEHFIFKCFYSLVSCQLFFV